MEQSADFYRRNESSLFIETASGRNFHFDKPEFHIEDIAHAIGMQCRYTGHCNRFYSVAEHSLLVSNIMEYRKAGDPFEGLMHDATEGYLSDIAAPWKAMLPDYKIMEHTLERKLRAHFGLSLEITDECKRADWLALFVETASLIPSGGKDWIAPPGIKEEAALLIGLCGLEIKSLTPVSATAFFLQKFHTLKMRKSNATA